MVFFVSSPTFMFHAFGVVRVNQVCVSLFFRWFEAQGVGVRRPLRGPQ